MPTITIPKPTKNLYIVTDSHLDYDAAPYQEFVTMLSQLENPQVVVCLGDLFKVWLALPKFWLPLNKVVMDAFAQLQQKGVVVIFVVGNREVLLPRNWNAYWQQQFPFTHLIREKAFLEWGDQRFGLIHGDTINQQDHQYLRWRKIARSQGFEWLFRAMPVPLAQWVVHRLEKGLAQSNQEFKIAFPENEVESFARTALPEVDQFFVGHFHLDREICLPERQGVLRIVPDWLSKRAVLQITPEGHTQTLYFQNNSFSND